VGHSHAQGSGGFPFLLFFSSTCNVFCPFVSQRRKEKNKRKVPPPQGHRPHQGTLHSILKRAGNTLVIYLTKAVIFFSLLHSFIQVQCSSCASLQVETRNCCVCASVCPSVTKPQRPSAHVEVYIRRLAADQHKSRMCCCF